MREQNLWTELRTACAEPIYANRPLDLKSLKSRDLGSHPANLASAAIQCFEQPHRFAASSGFRSGEAPAARTLFVIVNGTPGPLLLWRWTAAVHTVSGKRASYAPRPAVASV